MIPKLKILLPLICLFMSLETEAKKPENTYIRVSTSKGDMIIKLYNETPKHRDNFIKLVNDKFYDGTLFHRVIKDFMIQGGDPNSKNAKLGEMLGMGNVGYMIDYEFQDSLFHKKGALAAARNDNPKKASSGCQFYIVQGKKVTSRELVTMELQTGMIFRDYHKKIYAELGGTPFLDRNYTVFGEVVEGLGIIDDVADVETDDSDRPKEDVMVLQMEVLKNREAKKLIKRLSKK